MTNEIYVEMAATTGRAAEVSLEEHLTFERLLSDLSARFANASGDQLETEIESGLKQLLTFLDFDRSNFGEFTADGWATILCSVAAEGVERYPPGPVPKFAGWYLSRLRTEENRKSAIDRRSSAGSNRGSRIFSPVRYPFECRHPSPCRRTHCWLYQLFRVSLDAGMARRPHRAAKDRWRGDGSGARAQTFRGCASGERREMAVNVRGIKPGHFNH